MQTKSQLNVENLKSQTPCGYKYIKKQLLEQWLTASLEYLSHTLLLFIILWEHYANSFPAIYHLKEPNLVWVFWKAERRKKLYNGWQTIATLGPREAKETCKQQGRLQNFISGGFRVGLHIWCCGYRKRDQHSTTKDTRMDFFKKVVCEIRTQPGSTKGQKPFLPHNSFSVGRL